jgi:hypothetical protein
MSKILPIALVLLLALGWMGLQREETQATQAFIGVSSAQAEPTNHYFPAGYVIQPNENEPEVYEY